MGVVQVNIKIARKCQVFDCYFVLLHIQLITWLLYYITTVIGHTYKINSITELDDEEHNRDTYTMISDDDKLPATIAPNDNDPQPDDDHVSLQYL